MGSLTAAGAAGLGTGAFSSVRATRDVSVNVADDSSALLKLSKSSSNENAEYADGSATQMAINLNSSASGTETGSGINADATTIIHDIFSVENQGTQSAIVYVPPSSLGADAFNMSDDGIYIDPQLSSPAHGTDDSALGTLPDGTKYGSFTNIGGTLLSKGLTMPEAWDDSVTSTAPLGQSVYLLNPGESFDFGLYLKTNDNPTSSKTYSMDILADANLATKYGLGTTNSGT
ncbi:hypothetical protein [Halospeciosus flavus]